LILWDREEARWARAADSIPSRCSFRRSTASEYQDRKNHEHGAIDHALQHLTPQVHGTLAPAQPFGYFLSSSRRESAETDRIQAVREKELDLTPFHWEATLKRGRYLAARELPEIAKRGPRGNRTCGSRWEDLARGSRDGAAEEVIHALEQTLIAKAGEKLR
jgi:hypothetical protein